MQGFFSFLNYMNRLRELGQKDINEGEIWKVFFFKCTFGVNTGIIFTFNVLTNARFLAYCCIYSLSTRLFKVSCKYV